MSDPQYVIVELRNPAILSRLQNKVAELKDEIRDIELQLHRVEQMYGDEVQINAILVDLLKANGISFRKHLDHRYRSDVPYTSPH